MRPATSPSSVAVRIVKTGMPPHAEDRERVLEALRSWMLTAEPSDSAKITAAKLLGETQGMFKQHQTVETVRSSDELLAELDSLLEQVSDRPEDPDDSSEPTIMH